MFVGPENSAGGGGLLSVCKYSDTLCRSNGPNAKAGIRTSRLMAAGMVSQRA